MFKKISLIIVPVLFLSVFVLAQDCPNGYEWKRMSGVGCVQIDCESVPGAHYGYVGNCVCGSSGSINEDPKDANVECYRDRDYEACPGCVYLCVHSDENCPDDINPRVGLPEDHADVSGEEGIDGYDGLTEGYENTVDTDDIAPIGSEGDRPNRPIEELSQLYIVQPKKQNASKEYVYELDDLDEDGCSPVERVVFYKDKISGEIFTSCECRPGFKRGERGCYFDKPDVPFSDIDMRLFEETLLNLQPNENIVFESKYSKTKYKIGIVRRSDHELAFTVDGRKWDSNVKDLIDPSQWTKVKKGWGKAWSMLNPINWFDWHTKYKDEDKEMKWQVADATLKRYDKDITKPKHYMHAVKYWYEYAEDKRKAVIKLRDNGLLPGGFDLSKGYLWGDIESNLKTFPAQAVHIMAKELRTDDFAQAFSIYANMRKTKTPAQIINDPGEELDLAISAGTASLLGDVLLYQKYEEAYQRYLVSGSLKEDKD